MKETEPPAATTWCAECEHWVRPDRARGVSLLVGTVVTIDRCAGCETVLVPEPHPAG
jgi:hypothetical protein